MDTLRELTTDPELGAAVQSEGTRKAEVVLAFEAITAKVATVAGFTKATRQVLSDNDQLAQFLERRLTAAVNYALEMELLLGDGTGSNIGGMTLPENIVAYDGGAPTGSTPIDVIRLAIAQAQAANQSPDLVILHPLDWADIELVKDDTGRYIWGNPAELADLRAWSTSVLWTPALPRGGFVVAAAAESCTLYVREEANLLIGFENDDFIKDILTFLVELRATRTREVPSGIIRGGLDGADELP